MILCIDCGNTRLKWALYADSGDTLAAGNLGHDEIRDLASLSGRFPAPSRVLLANVAGDLVGQRIRDALGGWSACLVEVQSSAQAGGVTNLYENPARLGVDRWCALIGARSLVSGACLVVMAGTATTIDLLDETGCFLGGCILPGIDAMRAALAAGTANLPLANGRLVSLPRNTHDAISSGILHAQLGAIERLFACLPGAQENAKTCLLSGGYANGLCGALVIPARVVENLPLLGLKALGLSADPGIAHSPLWKS